MGNETEKQAAMKNLCSKCKHDPCYECFSKNLQKKDMFMGYSIVIECTGFEEIRPDYLIAV